MPVPDAVTFVPVDFNRETLQSALDEAGYNRAERTLFLWEGVIYYLEAERVQETLDFAARSAGRSTIAFDYAVTVTPENAAAMYGAQAFSRAMEDYHAREALLFTIPDGDIERFLAERGLRLVRHLDSEEIEQMYLTGDDGKRIGRVSGNFRLASAQPVR